MTTHTKRFRDAHMIIDPGACNPSGLARSLVEAIDGCRADNEEPRYDPACRLIAYQLASLLGMEPLGSPYADLCTDRVDSFRTDDDFCRKIAALTDAQIEALETKWAQSDKPESFTDFLRKVEPQICGDGAVMVPWAGMWVGIEPDGYAHT